MPTCVPRPRKATTRRRRLMKLGHSSPDPFASWRRSCLGGPPRTAQRFGESMRGFSPINLPSGGDAQPPYRLQNRPYTIPYAGLSSRLSSGPNVSRRDGKTVRQSSRSTAIYGCPYEVLSLGVVQATGRHGGVDSRSRGADSEPFAINWVRRGLIRVCTRHTTAEVL